MVFLGDAVLQLIITHALYERFSGFDEGLLTKTRASLVNKRALAAQGRNLRLGECVSLSPGEEAQGGRDRDSIQAATFEAVLRAGKTLVVRIVWH